jgi:hypothetical protein
MQMVVVPAMSTNATTEIAKVSFTVLPQEKAIRKRRLGRWRNSFGRVRVNVPLLMLVRSLGESKMALNPDVVAAR